MIESKMAARNGGHFLLRQSMRVAVMLSRVARRPQRRDPSPKCFRFLGE
jgi:hypothetical protein